MEDRINDSLLRQILGDGDSCPVCNRVSDCVHDRTVENGCGGCSDRKSWGLSGYPLAMVYSPLQSFEELYDLDCALAAGTVFKKLDLPFMGMTVTKGGGCRD